MIGVGAWQKMSNSATTASYPVSSFTEAILKSLYDFAYVQRI